MSLTRVDEGGTCWLGSTASTCRLHFKSHSLLSLLSQVQLLSVSEVCGGVPVCVCACVYAGKVCLQVLLKSSCTAHCCAHVDSWLVCLNEYKCNYLCECGCMFLCMCVCVKRISGKLATVSVSSHLNWKCAVCLIFNLQSFGAAANQCVSRSRSVR